MLHRLFSARHSPAGAAGADRRPGIDRRRRRAAAARGAAQFGVPQMLSSVCQPGLEADRGGRGHDARLPALRARRRRLGGRLREARARPRLHRLLPHRGRRHVQPARARPGRALHQALARHRAARAAPSSPGCPGTRSSDSRTSIDLPLIIKGIATVEDAEDRRAARRRRDLRLQPRRPPARPRPGQRRRAAARSSQRSQAAPKSGSTAASCAAPTW